MTELGSLCAVESRVEAKTNEGGRKGLTLTVFGSVLWRVSNSPTC